MFKDNKGFTLIEMLIVMMIISVLIILIVPNLSGRSAEVNAKGCDALVSMVQAQVDAYYIEKHEYPKDLEELRDEGFITADQLACSGSPDSKLTLDAEHNVINPYGGDD
ncbi:competence type IV pilus major pilin ComGC [Oceanobacillus halophilus]|uniref:Prepilin-type N-terminal cleavage/methylation domain-containing protein n=1 Tax=Oceanobacillus halophilus TaxID=930130 RepID=A0A495ACT9_9BACI|nr:competence type IV pilus major pilin ComGC [Oceanobacillus halophilus]RKQ37781.1 prepilin-type N-terminal cleavage/methylation domain-containing protein [Oceanobacillus halophilus]